MSKDIDFIAEVWYTVDEIKHSEEIILAFMSLVAIGGILLVLGIFAIISICLSLALIVAAAVLFVQNARYGSGLAGALVCLILGLSGLLGVFLFALIIFL